VLETERGQQEMDSYYRDFARIAQEADVGLMLLAPTWRANPDWGSRLGYDAASLDRVNQSSIQFLRALRTSLDSHSDAVVAGLVGPRGDGYVAGDSPDLEEARAYHRAQIESFASAGADAVEALTMTNPNEAGGVVLAANEVGLPVGILFTVETNGLLPDGTTLQQAVERVDSIGDVAWFGINCAYPDHIFPALKDGEWIKRIAEIRPNASTKSHAELDEAEELDVGDVEDLAMGVTRLMELLPNLSVIGGCCGTDHRHVARLWNVAQAWSE
jgi:homocysteine S-methyltransferase